MRTVIITFAAAALLSPGAALLPATSARADPAEHTGQATQNDFTHGEVACGGRYNGADFVVRISSADWDAAAHCGEQMSITDPADGKSLVATVVDVCERCGTGDLELTPGLFQALFNTADTTVPVSWTYVTGRRVPAAL
ncbi:RlpA-like double-psi beta-barrel domain-containing protein [Streptomyces sp. NPDC059582]|uniref:RlpA-like double-psi beta-barrel domain-containing protein n=1 Tax=Streptomyces sp. NPDC059582 TaxID=3346875 RepID=UPI0036743E9A